MRCERWALVGMLGLGAVGCNDAGSSDEGSGTETDGGTTSQTETTGGAIADCAALAPDALRTCVYAYGSALMDCYATTGAACSEDDPAAVAALTELQSTVEAECGDGELFGLSTAALVGRLRNACASEAGSAAWRAYGGPHGAVWASASDQQACLTAAHQAAIDLIDASLLSIGTCLADEACDRTAVASERDGLAATAQAAVEAACSDLASLVAVDPATYVSRVSDQVDCLTATAHGDTTGLPLSCGPTNGEIDPPRGQWTLVPVDGDKWGTLCGDGTGYAFWIRVAPEGEPLDRVVIALEGGGVCVFEEDCAARMQSNPALFNAMDAMPIGAGIASDDPSESPFASWTKVYLPYCTQDVFAGGGVTEVLGAIEVPRYGSVNLRAAVRMVRDYLWRELDAAGGDGFRPDQLVALFGGFSAGAYGTNYNYHWLLDDLQWPRTIAFPDAGLGLDNGELLGVSGLGEIKIPVWGSQPYLPPYCFAGECAVGPAVFAALSPRLKRVPEQQMLILSNPRDSIQQNDAFFDDEATWINTMRQAYCDTKDLPGINYYFTSVSDQSIHVVSVRPELWTGEVDGEIMRDWFLRAVEDPDALQSRVEEADFVEAVPGVEPYPCDVPP